MKIRMARTARCLATVGASIALAACDATGPDVRRQLESQLRTQEASWTENGASTYSVRILRDCQCANVYDVRLEVVDGAIESGVHVFAGDPLTPTELAAQLALADLFAVVQDALDRRVATVSVQYNQEFGYVQLLYIDYDRRTADDDVTFSVSEYTPAAE